MADDNIAVVISAQIEGLKNGLKDATQALQEFSSQVKEGFKGAGEGGDEFKGKMETALDLGIFLEAKEAIKTALETIEQGFEKTAGAAMEFGLENAKFAAMMGSTTEHAAGLDAALKSVGVGLQEYEQLAMRMQMRLKEQETAFNSMGMATRDSNDNLMQGEALMQSAINTMREYKTGTDQNEFALQVFGRRAQDIYDIMRIQNVEQQQYIQDMKDLGVNTGDTAQSSVELEAAMGRQKQQWEDVGIALGQKLMPIMTEFFNWMNNTGKPILNGIGDVIKFLIEEFVWLATTVDQVALAIALPLADMTEAVIGFAKVAYDVFTLQWGSVPADAKAAWDGMKDNWKQMLAGMEADSKAYQSIYNALYGPKKPKEPEANPFAQGGTKNFHPYDPKAAENARKMAAEILKTDEALALGRVKANQTADSAMLALGKETEDQYYASQVKAEEDSYNIKLNFLQKKAEADKGNKLAHQKDLDDIAVLEQTHTNTLDKLYGDYLRKKQQEDEKDMQRANKLSEEVLGDQIADIETAYRNNQITAQERAALELGLTTTVKQQVLARMDAEIAGLTPGTTAYKQAMQQREDAARKFSNDVKKINNDLYTEENQKWTQLGNSIKSSFNGAINGMILGTMSFKQAMGQIINGIVTAFLDMGEKLLEDWITVQVEKALISKATDTTSSLSQISAAAGVAGANTFASIAAIPIVGPAMAPGAAAASISSVLSFSSLAFAEKGMALDRDQLVFAHKDEKILPAPFSRGLDNLIASGGAGGDAHLHYAPTINAPQPKSLGQMLSDESSTMISWVQARVRDGSLKVAGR